MPIFIQCQIRAHLLLRLSMLLSSTNILPLFDLSCVSCVISPLLLVCYSIFCFIFYFDFSYYCSPSLSLLRLFFSFHFNFISIRFNYHFHSKSIFIFFSCLTLNVRCVNLNFILFYFQQSHLQVEQHVNVLK